METSRRQAAQTAEIFTRSGLNARVVCSGELDADVVIGSR
ncbi:hypothetical protein HMPREF9413_2310 [Paenibacillus sp. HGF7]|nr:hypothetical protein HMPREF9413_2310 [Paenibacillus sp. HGF7]